MVREKEVFPESADRASPVCQVCKVKRACPACRANPELKALLVQPVFLARREIAVCLVWTDFPEAEVRKEIQDHLDRLDLQVLLDHLAVTEAKVTKICLIAIQYKILIQF